jgi:molybdenum cofactor biosynthesis enzyme MoaA
MITACCYFSPINFRATPDFAQDLKRFENECNAVIEKQKRGEPISCGKCPQYKLGRYPIEPELNHVSFDTGLKHSGCNVRCCYCHAGDKLRDESIDITLYECVKALEGKYGDSTLSLSLSSGEFTICPDAERILDIVEKKNWSTKIFTNGRIYMDRISDMAKGGNIPMVFVSADAGTKATFAKVKGVDYWETLNENLAKYRENGVVVSLKYILLEGINDNEEDMDGFFELARKAGGSVRFSNDSRMGHKRLSERSMAAAKYFIRSAEDFGGMASVVSPSYFNENDMRILREIGNLEYHDTYRRQNRNDA